MSARSHTRNRRRAIKRQIHRHAMWHAKHGGRKEPSKRRKLAAKRQATEIERTFAVFAAWQKLGYHP